MRSAASRHCRGAALFAAAACRPIGTALLASVLALSAVAGGAAEPDESACADVLGKARDLLEPVLAGTGTRRFAERLLEQALVERGNGEFDDCVEYAELAIDEIRRNAHPDPLPPPAGTDPRR